MKCPHLLLLVVFMLHSCLNVNPKENAHQVDPSVTMQSDTVPSANKSSRQMTQLALYNNVKTNLILCDNFEFVIRVDQLVNDSLRYLCWKKPKSITEIPDLIIENGIALEKTKTDRQEYVFSNGEWNYALEKIVVGEVSDIVHIFFEISDKDGKENYAWKMRDLTRSTYANIR